MKFIKLSYISLLIMMMSAFCMYAAEESAAAQTTAEPAAEVETDTVEIETEDGVTSKENADISKEEAEKRGKEIEKEEKNQKKQEKLDRYQAQLLKKLEMSIDGYNAAAAIPVIDMYRHRMLGGGAACIVTGSIMFILSPIMMSIGGYYAFDKNQGYQVIRTEDGQIQFYDDHKEYLPAFIAGVGVFGMGVAFGIMSLIITPMCSIYFSKAHKSKLVLRRLKGLAMLQGIGVDYLNDGQNEKVGLSMGFKI